MTPIYYLICICTYVYSTYKNLNKCYIYIYIYIHVYIIKTCITNSHICFHLYNRFAVDNTTGVITKQSNVSLDREKRDEYVLTLMARDGGGNLQTVEVTVKLKDVNDNPPIFSQSSYIGFIKENSSTFDQPVTVSVSTLNICIVQ